MKPIKIKKGHYKYRGSTIEKITDEADLDWRIFNSKGEWENSYTTLVDCLIWLDERDAIIYLERERKHNNCN